MAAELNLVLTPTSKLAFKSFLLALSIFWLRESGFALGWLILFWILFGLLYLKPQMGAVTFAASSLSLLTLVFFTPPTSYELYLALGLGLIAALILGVKNLIYLNRNEFYKFSHFLLIAGLSYLGLRGFLPLTLPLSLLLFLEFYKFLGIAGEKRWLSAVSETLLLGEAVFTISLLPLNPFLGSALVVLFVGVLHDLILSHLQGSLSREQILKDASVLILLTLLILLGGDWRLT